MNNVRSKLIRVQLISNYNPTSIDRSPMKIQLIYKLDINWTPVYSINTITLARSKAKAYLPRPEGQGRYAFANANARSIEER